MAVYERTWRRYAGPLTGRAGRFLVLPRYALSDILRSRLFICLYLLCLVPAFVFLILIYLRHNAAALALFGITASELQQKMPITGTFFESYLVAVAFPAFLVAIVVGPGLVSADLRNNGLALYLARPFSRSDYLFGKLATLALLLSGITWVPGLALFLFQGYLEGGGWLAANLRAAAAIFTGSWAFIVALSLFTLAVSAWVKWKPVARILLVILFFASSTVGALLRLALGTVWGDVFSLKQILVTAWDGLFGTASPSGLPVGAAWTALTVLALACLGLFWRRIRAYEEVR
jgi:ABC-2 type transport system permease protein